MAKTPRSTSPTALSPAALVMFSTPLVIPSLAANTTTAVTVTPVSNKFRPTHRLQAMFSAPLPAGIVFSTAEVSGNVGSYTITLTFGNLTAAPIVPTQTVIGLFQE